MKITFDTLPDVIWGTMYGEKRTEENAIIISIKKSELHKTVSDDSVIYVWGWPGPDGNIYDKQGNLILTNQHLYSEINI